MRELKSYFVGIGQVKGYIFNQLSITDKAYLYEVVENNVIHYEVFKRVENTRFNCVSYPSDKAFGLWAWTFMSLEKANKKFDELNNVANE